MNDTDERTFDEQMTEVRTVVTAADKRLRERQVAYLMDQPIPDQITEWGQHGVEYAKWLLDQLEQARAQLTEFAEEAGFEGPVTSLDEIQDSLLMAMADATDHVKCPVVCEGGCGETLASTVCPRCRGAGSTSVEGYEECGDCGGDRFIHEGCVGKTYTELVAEVEQLRAQRDEARRDHAAAANQAMDADEEITKLRADLSNETRLHNATADRIDAMEAARVRWAKTTDEKLAKSREVILSMSRELAMRDAAIKRVRSEHPMISGPPDVGRDGSPMPDYCDDCSHVWPCPTIAALNGEASDVESE